ICVKILTRRFVILVFSYACRWRALRGTCLANSCSRQQRSGKEAVMTSLRIVAVSFLTAVLMWTGTASAEYNATKLRQVAGGYLDSLHLMTQLETSACAGYAGNSDSFANAMGDIAGYLNPT